MLLQLQHFGDLHLIARNFAMCACILAILTWRPGFSTVQSTCEQEPAASWCHVGKCDDNQCHRICCWEMLPYVLLPTNASRVRNQIDPCNYMRKSNQQLYSLSMNSKKSSVDNKVSDSSGWLMLMHYGEKGSITCINKSQTVLVDLCRCTKQTSRTYFSTSFWHRRILRSQGSQRTSKWELGRAKWEILVPLTALLFHHPQCLQNIVSMAPRAKRRSLCKQQLDRIFRAVAIGCDEPSTQNRSAAVDTIKAMKQNVPGLVCIDGNDWLLPQLEAYAFPIGQAVLLQCSVPF